MDFVELPEERRWPRSGRITWSVTDGSAGPSSPWPRTRTGLRSSCCTTQLIPALPHGPPRIGLPPLGRGHPGPAWPDDRRRRAACRPPTVDLVLRIAGDDRLLPEKATSFQPKPSLGVLIRSLRDE